MMCVLDRIAPISSSHCRESTKTEVSGQVTRSSCRILVDLPDDFLLSPIATQIQSHENHFFTSHFGGTRNGAGTPRPPIAD
jgi:hypothetical protein